MQVETDMESGFCFGVQNAVKTAEEALKRGEKVYSLGPIVHNEKEIERLASLGLITLTHEQFRMLKGSTVLIRAHGEPPETYRIADENNITIIEATCPIVKKLQSRIRKIWIRAKEENGQVVIYGKPGHAEVRGLLGQTDNEGVVIAGKDDIAKIDLSGPVYLFSQTTMSKNDYKEIAWLISRRMQENGPDDPEKLLTVYNTICGQVSNREPHMREFAKKHDVIIFVSGKESSNGRHLFSVCRSVNPDSHFVSSVEEIDAAWFGNKSSAGVCGATSTPKWLIEEIHNHILGLNRMLNGNT
jgi:4-hydroxy-3-methylbut-2-enyl diphosphate reductase